MDDIKLIHAKNAIFKLIAQYNVANKFDDGELYLCDYCESALEAAFSVIGVEDDCVSVKEFCRLWEENNRAIWAIHSPGQAFDGITADVYYRMFEDDYNSRIYLLDEIMCDIDETSL